jgi:hypothetical protein
MQASRLSRAEAVALLGAVLLAIGVFLSWYHLENANNAINGISPARGSGTGVTITGWQAHPTIRWLLLAAAIAPLVLAYIVLRGHDLSWPRGEMTAVVAIAAAGIIFYVAIVNTPGTVRSLTSLRPGVFVALAGALLMAGGSSIRASTAERPRKPPGVL